MLGTIVNAVAILLGGAVGLLLKGGMKQKYQEMIMTALGLSVVYVGASGAIGGLLDPDAESLLFIISLVVGSVIGEWLDIEAHLKALGDWIEAKMSPQGDVEHTQSSAKNTQNNGTNTQSDAEKTQTNTQTSADNTKNSTQNLQNDTQTMQSNPQNIASTHTKASGNISLGFVNASLIFCVGSMAILGSIESGIRGDHATLYIKSILDGTMSIVLASTMGLGVLLSAVSVFLYQGSITLFAQVLQPFITADMIRELSIVGGVLISCIGINILKIKEIKVGNMLPAILIPILYYLPFVQSLLH